MNYGVAALAAAWLLSAPALFGATINGSVSCSDGVTQTASSPGTCNVGIAGNPVVGPSSNASASTTVSLFSVDAKAGTYGKGASSSSEVTETFWISSAGPVRPGWLWVDSFAYGTVGASASVEFLSWEHQSGVGSMQTQFFYPVMLGTTFEMQLSASAVSTGIPFVDDLEDGTASFALQFYEGDVFGTGGPAPVAIQAFFDVPAPTGVPEPASLALGGISIMMLAVSLHKRLVRLAT